MMTHILKTVQPYYADVVSGVKSFELRKNDRNFATEDYLLLCEYNAKDGYFTGEAVKVQVTYLFGDDMGIAGLKSGYVIMAIRFVKSGFIPELQDLKEVTAGLQLLLSKW